VFGFIAAGEGDVLVIAGLNLGASGSRPDAVDVLDVGGATPPGHQCASRSAAVFVGEDDGVLEIVAGGVAEALAVGQQRDVGETSAGFGTGVDDGRMSSEIVARRRVRRSRGCG
jgi:hypothetical protein